MADTKTHPEIGETLRTTTRQRPSRRTAVIAAAAVALALTLLPTSAALAGENNHIPVNPSPNEPVSPNPSPNEPVSPTFAPAVVTSPGWNEVVAPESVTFTGTAAPGAAVHITYMPAGGAAFCNTIADNAGAWSCTGGPLIAEQAAEVGFFVEPSVGAGTLHIVVVGAPTPTPTPEASAPSTASTVTEGKKLAETGADSTSVILGLAAGTALIAGGLAVLIQRRRATID